MIKWKGYRGRWALFNISQHCLKQLEKMQNFQTWQLILSWRTSPKYHVQELQYKVNNTCCCWWRVLLLLVEAAAAAAIVVVVVVVGAAAAVVIVVGGGGSRGCRQGQPMPPPHSELWLSIVSKVTLSAQLNSHDIPPQEQELNPQPPEHGRVNYIPM
jgi:hypothetical protein